MGQKTGPKPRPGRNPYQIATQPHVRVVEALQAGADKYGVPRGVYMDYLLSRAVGLNQYAPELPDIVEPQEELPLEKTA